MSDDYPAEAFCERREIAELLPWYVNGSLGERERQRMEAHLIECAVCREALLVERRIYGSMCANAAVEYMPAASLKRLQARLTAWDAGVAPPRVARAEERGRTPAGWSGWMAASVAAAATALSLLAANRWILPPARVSPASYYTLTTPEPRAKEEVIRAVFSPTTTVAELQAILAEAQLRIVAGPSEAGVYSLATNSSRPVDLSLALLREHAAVRFAEITRITPRPRSSSE